MMVDQSEHDRVIAKEKARIAAKFEREWDRLYWHSRIAIGLIVALIVARIFLLLLT